jgi:hypothetical protein
MNNHVCGCDRVWDALKATITDLGYKDVKEDHGAGTIE